MDKLDLSTLPLRPIVVLLAAALLLNVAGLRNTAWPQTTKQNLGAPVVRLAQLSGTYIGLYKACGVDARAFRQHYENRVRTEAHDDEERDLALSLLASSIDAAAQSVGSELTPAKRSEACEKFRGADWHDFAKIIDDGLAGKGRY